MIDYDKIILVVKKNHPDMIYLETSLPLATYPYDDKLSISFQAANGGGLDFINQHLIKDNVELEIVHE